MGHQNREYFLVSSSQIFSLNDRTENERQVRFYALLEE